MADDDGATNDDQNKDASDGDDKGAQAPEAKTFTQAQLEKIIQDRVAREAKKYEGFDDLKAKAEKFDALDAASKTELEKEREARAKAETDAKAATDRANARLIQAEVLAAATTQKALRPEHMHKLIDTGQVTVGDDGQVIGAGEAVKAFLEANPEYVGTTRGNGSADQGARDNGGPQQLTRAALAGMSAEEITKATAEGRLTSVLSGG